MPNVLIQPVLPGELGLHRDELLARVALVRHEEQAGVQPAQAVRAVHEVVPAPQQPDAVVPGRVGEADVGVHGDGRLAVRAGRGEVRFVELGQPAVWRADALGTADDLLLLGERGAVPVLDQHPDLAGHQVRAAGHPVRSVAGGHPDLLVEQRVVLGLEVGCAVLEAEQVARGGLAARGGRGAAEAELGPAHGDGTHADAGQVAHRVHRDRADVAAVTAGDHAVHHVHRLLVVGHGDRQAEDLARPDLGRRRQRR